MKALSLFVVSVLAHLFSYSTCAQGSKGSSALKEDECKISGMVVKLAGGEPLRKAKVQLQSLDDRTHSVSVVTDAGGRFVLKGIEPGRYNMFVSRSGFVSQEYGQRKPEDPGAILALRPSQEMNDLVFRLIPSAVISGRILDEDGEPLASVMVSASREVYAGGKRALATLNQVSTNDLGEYRLFGLAPGRYIVSAIYLQGGRFGGNGTDSEGADSEEHGYAKMYYPGTPDRSKAMSIAIKSGEEISSMEIFMHQVLVYHVRGHVLNLVTRKPGTEVNVFLTPKRTGREWEFSNHQAFVQKKDGSFDISEVLPGSYVLVGAWFDEGKAYSTRLSLEVGNGNVDGLSLTIGPGVNVNGRIILGRQAQYGRH